MYIFVCMFIHTCMCGLADLPDADDEAASDAEVFGTQFIHIPYSFYIFRFSLFFFLFLIYEFNKWVSLFWWFPEEPDDDSVHVFTGHTGKISSSSSLLSFFSKVYLFTYLYAFEHCDNLKLSRFG